MINDSSKNFMPQQTADGSQTFFSEEFGELFHSYHGAKQEAELKFVCPTQLEIKARSATIFVLDICYGLGYNTATALTAIWKANPNCHVRWIGLESNVCVPQAAIAQNILNEFPKSVRHILEKLAFDLKVKTENFDAQLFLGDARKSIQKVLEFGFLADAIFLDPFSPPNCPQLWTIEFLKRVVSCLKPSGYLATYSCAAAVRSALIAGGLYVGSTVPIGRKSPGTIASFFEENVPPLSLQEREHLQTRAAIPYRDPYLSDSSEVILQRRRQEQQISLLEPTSRWKKRWLSFREIS